MEHAQGQVVRGLLAGHLPNYAVRVDLEVWNTPFPLRTIKLTLLLLQNLLLVRRLLFDIPLDPSRPHDWRTSDTLESRVG